MANFRLLNQIQRQCKRCFCDYKEYKMPPAENPIKRTGRILSNDFKKLASTLTGKEYKPKFYKYDGEIPRHSDVVIIGGGIMGSAIAYFMRTMTGKTLNITVYEKDLTYSEASTVLSVGGLRQQFSLPENILMSQYAAEFFRDIKYYLGDVDLQFTPHGYLILANEKTAPILEQNHLTQREFKVKNELLSADQLKRQFPWMNTDGIVLGCRGLENEGWFDPWALLLGFKKKAMEIGVNYVQGEVMGFEFEKQGDVAGEAIEMGTFERPIAIHVKTPSGAMTRVEFSLGIIAAGAASGEIAKKVRIGRGEHPLLKIALPVEPRKRYVYCFQCQNDNAPGLATPMVFDPSGTYFRREGLGNMFIAGRAPSPEDEPDTSNLDVDYDFFDNNIWPILAQRVPAFNEIKVRKGWAGYYEFNHFDENGIVGNHPYLANIYMATGFSGHGIQQAPAVGRAIAELICEGAYTSIDLTRLGFDRFLTGDTMYESNIF